MFRNHFFTEAEENGVRIQVRDGEKRKSATFEIHTTKTARTPTTILLSNDMGAQSAPVYVHDKIHAAAGLAAAPAAYPWIHGSIFFILNHIFYYEMKNNCLSP